MTTSTQHLSRTRRKSLESPVRLTAHAGFGGRLPGKGPCSHGTSPGSPPYYYLLESAGLNVQLVNSRHARQLAGRPKTDQKDAQQIARLAEMGLLRPSFVPPPKIRALRDLARTRVQVMKDRTREWQRLEK